MTIHPSPTPAAAQQPQPDAQALADRVAALELYMQQLVFVLDAQGKLNADALTRWINLARSRMAETGSAPDAHISALARLQALVQA